MHSNDSYIYIYIYIYIFTCLVAYNKAILDFEFVELKFNLILDFLV